MNQNMLTRMTAFLVEQEGFQVTLPSVNETQANDVTPADVNALAPGRAVAAASFILKPVDWRMDSTQDPDIWLVTHDFTDISIIGEAVVIDNLFDRLKVEDS
ncbi:unnamed protein product [Dibothriocephalus latus]|uniref:Uncharacterized protein n=1 Tax=Dibothriocephalus latus TaxID=60516 RepID=A0A3P7NW75_DIBLA|nr:unnamed protein product [Dibothriocephalus latus]